MNKATTTIIGASMLVGGAIGMQIAPTPEPTCPPETFCIVKEANILGNSMTKAEFDDYATNKEDWKYFKENKKIIKDKIKADKLK